MFEVDFLGDVMGTCRRHLLTLKADCPLDIHLFQNEVDPARYVKQIIDGLGNTKYVIIVRNTDAAEVVQKALQVPEYHVQSVVAAKYTPAFIPSVTDVIVWDLWSISKQLCSQLLEHNWAKAHVFAKDIGFSTGRI